MVNEVTFVGFRGSNLPLDPTLGEAAIANYLHDHADHVSVR